MLDSIVTNYRKLKENGAYNILLHPKVLANYRLHQKEAAERPLVMHSHPPGIEIEMTNRCNLACIQCLRSLGLKPYKLGDMDFENYKKILAQFPYVMNLSLNGFGEPMMYKHFFEVVEYSRKERPWCKIGIYSNGMLINEEKAYRLMNCGLTELNISIDAAYPDTYRRVRRGGKLDVLHENIRRLVRVRQETRARFPMIGMNFVMLNDNEGELVPFVEQAAEFSVDFLNCITYASYDWGFKNKRTPDSYKRELDAAWKRMEELGVRCKSFPSPDISWSDPKRPFDCQFFWGDNFRVTYSGEITLGCCTPFKETYSYGNLLERPFSEIWNNEFFQRNRELAKKHIAPTKTCASCDAFCKSFFAPRDGSEAAFVPASSLAATANSN
ncbi:MAG TPA: radical SAM protein [Chthonomonadaceae bacterium]|nr:radical SAM protein [Chthonomonadaceae bacterium]